MENPEDTNPNTTKARAVAALKTANEAADPLLDRLLLRVVASAWTTAIVGLTLLLVFGAGVYVGVKVS